MCKKILFSSGGTGGHIFPTLSTINFFLKKGYKCTLVTDKRAIKYLNENFKNDKYILETDTPSGKNILKKFVAYKKIFFSIIRSILILKKEKPDLVFGFGGYVSFPICIVSKLFKIPLIIYENNLILGKTNKYLLPFASKLLTSAKLNIISLKNYNNKISHVGNILREEILEVKNYKKSDNTFFNILVLGGSQGAHIFGQFIPTIIKRIKDKGFDIKIYQQCIPGQENDLINFYKKNDIESVVFNFSNKLSNLISNADLAISRSGASTLAEFEYLLTPFIAIPHPSSVYNHQYLNAKYYEEKNCCWLIEQKNLSTDNLFNLIIDILKNKHKIEFIKSNMKKNDSKFSLSKIEKVVEELIINEN